MTHRGAVCLDRGGDRHGKAHRRMVRGHRQGRTGAAELLFEAFRLAGERRRGRLRLRARPGRRKGIGGGIGASQDGGPGQVTFYVEVDDPAAYLAKAEKLGGQTIVPPSEIPDFGLTFAFFADPEGHVVGLSKGAVR